MNDALHRLLRGVSQHGSDRWGGTSNLCPTGGQLAEELNHLRGKRYRSVQDVLLAHEDTCTVCDPEGEGTPPAPERWYHKGVLRGL